MLGSSWTYSIGRGRQGSTKAFGEEFTSLHARATNWKYPSTLYVWKAPNFMASVWVSRITVPGEPVRHVHAAVCR